MKFASAYYLLLIYLTVMLQPLIPIAEDALFHCFAEAYHVATVHAKYGNNHVDVALANDENDNSNSKNQTTVKSGEQTLVHISVKEEILQHFSINQPKKIFYFNQHKLPQIFLSKNIHPPKFSCKNFIAIA